MPISKYKTSEQAETALWNFHPDATYYKKIAELWEFANQLNPVRCPQGVFKFRTIEEANADREAWELAEACKKRSYTGFKK